MDHCYPIADHFLGHDDESDVIISNESGDFDSRLIELVRSCPNLYDKFSPNFKSSVDRENSWTEIATALECTATFAQTRWLRLRERFSRVRRIIVQHQKKGEVDQLSDKKIWPNYFPMLFLSSHVKSRSSAGREEEFESTGAEKESDSAVEEEVQEEGKKEVVKKRLGSNMPQIELKQRKILAKPEGRISTVYLSLAKTPVGKASNVAPSGSAVLVGTDETSPSLQVSSTTSPSTSVAHKDPSTAEYHFGMLIAKELERLSPEDKFKKKQKLLMVLYE